MRPHTFVQLKEQNKKYYAKTTSLIAVKYYASNKEIRTIRLPFLHNVVVTETQRMYLNINLTSK